MKTLLSAAFLAVLSGCAATHGYFDAQGQEISERDLLECQHEATKATAGNNNAAAQGWDSGVIRGQCLRLKGYTLQRREK